MDIAAALNILQRAIAKPYNKTGAGPIRSRGTYNAVTVLIGHISELENELAKLRRERDWLLYQHETSADTRAVTPAVTARVCACGCRQPITSPRPEAKYATGACRVRAHRTRTP